MRESDKPLVRELRLDFRKWARAAYTIRDKRGQLVKLKLRPLQLAIEAAEAAQRAATGMARLAILKGRQGGVTTHQQAKSLFTTWRTPGAQCLTLAQERDSTDKIFKVTETALANMPPQLALPLGAKETREVSYPAMDSYFYTGTAGTKRRTGRGLTLTRVHGSEFGFWDEPIGTLNAIQPALERPGTTIVLETTASGFGSEAHQFYDAAAKGSNSYQALFFPWWACDDVFYRTPLSAEEREHVRASYDAEERALVSAHGLDPEQIAWRRAKMDDYTRDMFLQEYAEDAASCWLAAGGLVYDAAKLKQLMVLAPPVLKSEMNGALKFYATDVQLAQARHGGGMNIIGGDVAEGVVGGDRSTMVCRTREGRLLFTYGTHEVDPITYAARLNDVGRQFGNAFLVIEKNAHGITVLRHLRDVLGYPSERIYHRRSTDTVTTEIKDRIGWHTSAETKPLLVDAFREVMTAVLTGTGAVTPCAMEVVHDALGTRRADNGTVALTGHDYLGAECLAWIGRATCPGGQTFAPIHH